MDLHSFGVESFFPGLLFCLKSPSGTPFSSQKSLLFVMVKGLYSCWFLQIHVVNNKIFTLWISDNLARQGFLHPRTYLLEPTIHVVNPLGLTSWITFFQIYFTFTLLIPKVSFFNTFSPLFFKMSSFWL